MASPALVYAVGGLLKRTRDMFYLKDKLIKSAGAILVFSMVMSFADFLGGNRAYASTSESIQTEIDDLNAQKSEIQRRMDEIQAEIDSLDYEKVNTLEKKLILDKKNLAAQEELDVIQEQIDIIDSLLSNIQSDLAEARGKEEYQRELWLTRVREMEENSNISYLDVLFRATSFSDFLTRLDLVNEVMDYDERLEADYIAARENVEALEAQAEEMYAKNTVNRQELETKKTQLETDIASACLLIEQMESNIDEYNEVMEQEERTQAEVSALIIEKEKELANARAAEEAARLAALAAQRSQGGNSAPTASDATASSSGSWMIWPSYTKYLTSKFGPRYLSLYGYTRSHNGVDIGASYGSNIWAASGGTVILAGWNGGYGNCVMINHGNGYTTLYGHMSKITVSQGETVSQGQIVGYVGSTGNSTGPHLHFEVRASATAAPMDPMSFQYLT